MALSQLVGTGSILSLQELAKEPIVAIPQSYICVDQEPPVLSGTTCLPTVPIIDMEHLVTTDNELEKLHSACKELGLFQLVNHGVSNSLVEKLKHEIEEFFKLPLEEKMKYKRRPGQVEGYGQTLLVSEDQKLDWSDKFYMMTNPISIRKPHLLPQLPPSLRDTLETYCSELQKLAMTLMRLMGKALRMDERAMEEMFEDGMQAVRMSYYPPCPQPELVVGLTPHSDATGITILLQVNEVEGFQIKKDGLWIPVSFHPNAFVVNVGDIMEIFSNGTYASIEHRAAVNSMKERMSIAMFFNSKLDAEIGPATSLITPQNPPIFKRVQMKKYVEDFFSRKLDGKAYLEEMRIKNGEANSN
ncbi:hypothetical protein L1049_010542 [Liquidambar formosana]|uniref:Fe2OG dioxygenase domain-containing protein n=1 Tax=Liquidambar formosana TaxID=63359 RepID=A0AAP0N8Q2_LIQFO